MTKYEKLVPPSKGEKVTIKDGKWNIPDNPIVCWVEGDGIGPEISKVMMKIVDAWNREGIQRETEVRMVRDLCRR